MSRCNCMPFCPRCSDGPCDCICTPEQMILYKEEREWRAILQAGEYANLKKKAALFGLTQNEIKRLERGS